MSRIRITDLVNTDGSLAHQACPSACSPQSAYGHPSDHSPAHSPSHSPSRSYDASDAFHGFSLPSYHSLLTPLHNQKHHYPVSSSSAALLHAPVSPPPSRDVSPMYPKSPSFPKFSMDSVYSSLDSPMSSPQLSRDSATTFKHHHHHHHRSSSLDPFEADADLSSSSGSLKAPREFACNFEGCNATFTRRQNLRSHQSCHSNVRSHACTECNALFRRKQELLRHMRSVHGGEDAKAWGCPSCGKHFARADALRKHLYCEKSRQVSCSVGLSDHEIAQLIHSASVTAKSYQLLH
ncbi:uncharacterized protein BJ171DRAFT_524288 [Polychytrium aggregatum]|uniref:uncharacterized protein n=1 Tax=Polychytrium aggregatum TaxID=110093 RepID=UPI0022FDD450|nr:uncharacterized protein BJ171DRAFT_524288 [Polychytrium aggregatum]KAI9193703.1 hypothetical protein BJ171DRAFT_524288 [Polychytrium aggregatum]